MTAAFLAAAALAVVAACRRLWLIANVGAAYKAKVLCSALFGSGRAVDPAAADEVSAEAYRILRPFRAVIDQNRQTVTVSLRGCCQRRAIHRSGLGATLEIVPIAPMGPTGLPIPGAFTVPWPEGEAPAGPEPAALSRVFDEAFLEPDARKPRRTRAVFVAANGRLLGERYAPGFSASTPLPGWSMAKAVLSALIGVLVGDGRLSLARSRLLAEWSAPGDPRARISLEDLLRMRSGLRFAEIYSNPLSDVVQMLFARPDAARYAASRPLDRAPGEEWRYASGTTNILSLIARRALGDDYAGFPRRALFNPLGMASAVLEPDASGTFVGSSFMLASARDWARFGQLYARHGIWQGKPLLPLGWTAFSAKPTPQSPGECYGAHWWLKLPKELGGESAAASRLPADAMHALGHEGQCLSVIPSRGIVVVRLGLSIRIDAWDHAAFLASVINALGA